MFASVPGRERLRLTAIVIQDDRAHFVVVHDGDDFFRQPVHVAIRSLQAERRLGAKLVGLRGGVDVFLSSRAR
jgi:hypothetical protein